VTHAPAPEPPLRTRSFSIAFAWIGLLAGAFAWMLWWGVAHLPARGVPPEQREPASLDVIDVVLMFTIPVACAALAGRLGRHRLP
jgi:hypothetical protein